MTDSLVLLPMDDRPVNYNYPRYLARIAGFDLRLPPREWLGNPWRESRHADLVSWLEYEARTSDMLVVSVDTLAYGGLIPSRRSVEPLKSVIERLLVLRRLKVDNPNLLIFGSSVILRIARHNSSEEEKPYWATWGSRMFRLSYLEHKRELGEASAPEADEADELRKEIPDEVYADYRAGRNRNHNVNQEMLTWVGEHIFDYLILPQDDTADYGWNIAEARTLQARIHREELSEHAITYPGADEIGSLLLAAAACRQAGFRPRVFPRYSAAASPGVITAYEDRPIHELVKAHLSPLGGSLADSHDQADLLLYLNAPAHAQGEGLFQLPALRGLDWARDLLPEQFHAWLDRLMADPVFRATRRELTTPHRSPEEFVRALTADVQAGRAVALADVAFVNGADWVLGGLLTRRLEAAQMAAYGGWNTAGNTLGTVLAQAVLHQLAVRQGETSEQRQAHLEFLFLRYLDDYVYQAEVRTEVWLEDLPSLGLNPSSERVKDPALEAELVQRLRRRLKSPIDKLAKLFCSAGQVKAVTVENIHLPWQRLFEIGFDVHVTLSE